MAAPALAVSDRDGQLRGEGVAGLYRDGRRVLARCLLTVAGAEPVAVQAVMLGADRVRFVAVAGSAAGRGPDPAVTVERLRTAGGVERITVTNAGSRPIRLPVEIVLGTDLAALAAVAAGGAGSVVSCTVSGAGLRWTDGERAVLTTARPVPDEVFAATGALVWRLDLPAGGARTVELRTGPVPVSGAVGRIPPLPARLPALWPAAELEADDARAGALLRTSLDDLQSLLLRDPAHPADLHLAAGAPWRLAGVPPDALWAARMLLPFGTRLAAGTLRTLARAQDPGGGIPGPARDAGPHQPPLSCAVEAVPLFVTVLAEAWRWGLPAREVETLLPAAERCLVWLDRAMGTPGTGGLVADPVLGGPLRAEVQAHAHRAALHGADLLEAFGRPAGEWWRERAAELRVEFRRRFRAEEPGGGRLAVACTAEGGVLGMPTSALAHLLDTGLGAGGEAAPGLLDAEWTVRLARLLGAPGLDSGWGLRTLAAGAPGFSAFGHRSGAVRVHETAVAVAGLAAAGYEDAAATLLTGTLDAAAAFGMRVPEIYAGEQRAVGRVPCPHPMACRPAALAAGGAVHLLAALAGVRPDVPGGSVALRPLAGTPAGAVRVSGMQVAGAPFAVRIGRLGTAMVEEAAPGLRLGA
ncbi:glycogen debranching N-terminal domain-containing protein [Streptomyces sp. NRRL F-5123]|uniref:glycogen debranching N-terminal domain-containing protein n=1 Tax=Streptomyces sp. NRRL F-5123 TaxID=1463856 RepID=UPI0004E234F9|nr:glycogen debranching N-terminal domain-containing protein [Streptomyces sp. NRRL F-5123]